MGSDFFDEFSDKIKELIEKRREANPEKGEKFDALLQKIESSKLEFEREISTLRDEISRYTSNESSVDVDLAAASEREAIAKELLAATTESFRAQNDLLERALSPDQGLGTLNPGQ